MPLVGKTAEKMSAVVLTLKTVVDTPLIGTTDISTAGLVTGPGGATFGTLLTAPMLILKRQSRHRERLMPGPNFDIP